MLFSGEKVLKDLDINLIWGSLQSSVMEDKLSRYALYSSVEQVQFYQNIKVLMTVVKFVFYNVYHILGSDRLYIPLMIMISIRIKIKQIFKLIKK